MGRFSLYSGFYFAYKGQGTYNGALKVFQTLIPKIYFNINSNFLTYCMSLGLVLHGNKRAVILR